MIYAASGNCHVYVDAAADLDAAEAIVVNAKTQRPGVCNAAETLLVHADVGARRSCPRALARAARRGRRAARRRARRGAVDGTASATATEEDWATEFLALVLAVGVVDSVDGGDRARQRVRLRPLGGDRHRDSVEAARAFQLGVDAACVYVNASTRFTDGGEFGMGAEIGNSTQKLHARGPIGLRELCTFKYLVEGDGQVRP